MSGNTSRRYPPELKARAVRMYAEIRPEHESDWEAMGRVAELPRSVCHAEGRY